MKFLVVVCLTVLATVGAASFSSEKELYPAFHQLKSNTRITNGENAVQGAFPWQISIQSGIWPFYSHICGGSIISPTWVITAAHCLGSLNLFLRVVAGKYQLNRDEATEQTRRISKTFIHEKYGSGVGPNDIGLIKLQSAFDFNDAVAPIALPKSNYVHTGETVLSGWGSTSLTSSASFPNILQSAVISIVDTQVCYNVMDSLINSAVPLDPNTLDNVCAGGVDQSRISACSGDSGGPLAQQVNGIWELVGIVSWGLVPCGVSTAPSVFVRPSAYIDWINEKIAKNN